MANEEPGGLARPEAADEVLDEVIEDIVEAAPVGSSLPTPRSWQRFLPRRRNLAIWVILASLGPGLVTANAGNDAGGIATYAQVGATYGYRMLWVFPLILVALAVVQEMAARMGAATGKGLTDLMRENFSIQMTALVMLALLAANGGTVVSEFIGIAASVKLVHEGAQFIAVPLISLGLWLIVVRGSYRSVEKIFLLMTLVFFAYPISAIIARPDWGQALKHTVVPSIQTNTSFLFVLIATIGTSITPYMQVYIQSAVADRGITERDYTREKIEVYAGSIIANLVAMFIVIATAATLYAHHQTIRDAADAARALAPIAGPHAEILFATGLFGASMLAAAVLPLATAYAVTEAIGVEKGIGAGLREAPIFMGIFTGLIVIGTIIALIPGLPIIQSLLVVQVIDALLLPFILFSILRLVNNRRLMGNMVNGPIYNAIARLTAFVVTGLSLAYVGVTLSQATGLLKT